MDGMRADLQYSLFSIVEDVVEERRTGRGPTVLDGCSEPVVREIYRHARLLHEAALLELRRKLAAGFLHEVDRLLSAPHR